MGEKKLVVVPFKKYRVRWKVGSNWRWANIDDIRSEKNIPKGVCVVRELSEKYLHIKNGVKTHKFEKGVRVFVEDKK